jgi:Serine/threonine protein kinase
MASPLDPIASLRSALRGHYEIERELGQGAFATVYLARDLKHERKVALKVLHADTSSETGELRFIREIRLLARLQHPNILPLHDSGHVESLLYYVMPYVSGETLRDRIEHQRQLAPEVACNIARDIADALAYAHAQGVIHRDIKPENILLSAGHPILADFGIARVINLASIRQLTRTGMGSPGTPAYMSPEQLMGDHELDARSDIYSLGCVLYEMLAGKPPFMGKDGFVKRFTEPPPRISSVRADLPAWVDAAVAKSLEPNPQDRYQSANDFIAALRPPAPGIVARDHGNKAVDAHSPERNVEHSAGAAASPPLEPDAQEVSTTQVDTRGENSNGRGLVAMFKDGIRARPRAAAGVAAASLIALVALGAVFGTRKLGAALEGDATLDSTRLVIFPLAADARDTKILASHVSEGLYDVLEGDWDSLHVVEATKVDELTRKKGGPPATQSEALERARQLGARKMVWGQVLSASRIRATLYDVPSGASEKEVSLDRSPQKRDEFAQIATELLKVPGRPSAADGGDGGTRSFPAWRAYGLGHVALAQWDLPGAEQQFSAAVRADPMFAVGQLWLAQIRVLRNSYSPVEAWSEQVALALSTPRGLHQRDSILASALNSMASGDYGNACKSYRQLADSDARDYIAWYGLGFCGLADKTLVRDPRQPELWSFRSSFLRAAQAFDKATQLEPRLFAVLPFSTLVAVAPIQAGQLRSGVTSDKSKEVFLAYPSIIAETLAYTPFPLADIQAGRLRTTPKTAGLAAQQSRVFLLRVVLRWIRQFPASADAQEALSILQEAGGELGADRDGVPSALTAVLNAQKLTSDKEKRAQLITREVRLRLKRDEFERARALSDSLLASAGTISAPSADLAGLAALTGRLSSAQRLLPPASILVGSSDRSPQLPNEAIMSAAGALFVRAAMGACSEDFDRIATQLNSLFESYLPLRQQGAQREALTQRSWSMATPCRPAFALRVTAPVDRLLRMQQALARSQLNEVRAEFDSLGKLRENDRPGDVSPDVMFQEAWLLTAIGDTAAAIRKLDRSLSSLPTWGGFILDVPQAAGLVRAMILRADLAQTRGDVAASQKWARAASTLWANADPSLQPDVRRMRSIAQLRASPADPNQSHRR